MCISSYDASGKFGKHDRSVLLAELSMKVNDACSPATEFDRANSLAIL